MTATLRAMREEDLGAVLDIERASFPTPWTRGMFVDELARVGAGRVWLVAEEGGALLGYGGVAVFGDEAHIMDLAVTAAARRRGTGRALLLRLLAEAATLRATRATLEVRAGDAEARSLYRHAGFVDAGVRSGYYSDTGEDAAIMWTRALSPAHVRAMQGADADADLVLSIESSCDETAAAVMRGGIETLSSVVASQVDFHSRFGGVVPEIASRKHTEAIVAVVDEALARAGVGLRDLDALAVTYGPGLIGALVVGVAYAKGLALATGLPLVGVDHLEGHILANRLAAPELEPPFVALVVSGGHTALVHVPAWGVYHTLGHTLDDAAGEAFDKVAKLLGLGYPGGPVISRLAAQGDPTAIAFPRAMLRSGDYDFSLSGLKTAVINHVHAERQAGREVSAPDVAASFQAAVIDVQVAKAVHAAGRYRVRSFCLAGGVAANAALREALGHALAERGVRLFVPPLSLCTDNAAMIGAAAHLRLRRGGFLDLDAEALAGLSLDDAGSI